MADTSEHLGAPTGRAAALSLSRLKGALAGAGPPLLFGVRLWVSVCLALYVAFWLELENPFWAGTSAAIMCQPQLGASLRKGWFRIIGTVIGAIAIVVLTACFPQDRIAFLGLLALWCAICAFAATLLRNFASYAMALAGYTAVIIAADILGATGGANTEVFILAVERASEISIGIVCAGIVLAGTDLGGAQQRLAALFADLAAEVTGRFTGMMAQAGPGLPDTQTQRRDLVRRAIALDPEVDQAIGESSQLRYHSPVLQTAIHGLFNAVDGWRAVATHLATLPDGLARQQAEVVLRNFPPELQSAPGAAIRWMTDPIALRRRCEGVARTLLALPADTPSLRLLADQTAKLLAGILHVLDGLMLLDGVPRRHLPGHRKFRLSVPDWLPALVNAGRAFVAISAVALFWVVTAWPDGASAMTFVAIAVLLLSPRGDLASAASLAFTIGTAMTIPFAATIKFAVLPALEMFPEFCVALGLYLIPVGFGLAISQQPTAFTVFTVMTVFFVPLLAPENQQSYDTVQFYNLALALFAGCVAAALSFLLLPQLSPALRTRRLLVFALRDLRRTVIASWPPSLDRWEERMYGRLAALPAGAGPLQRAQLLAALSVGSEHIRLRHMRSALVLGPELDVALAALAQGNCRLAITQLDRLDHRLAFLLDTTPGTSLILRARASLLVLSEALDRHGVYFVSGAPA